LLHSKYCQCIDGVSSVWHILTLTSTHVITFNYVIFQIVTNVDLSVSCPMSKSMLHRSKTILTNKKTIKNWKRNWETYTKVTSSRTLFALNTINPHHISSSIHLQIIILRRSSNSNFRIIKPTITNSHNFKINHQILQKK